MNLDLGTWVRSSWSMLIASCAGNSQAPTCISALNTSRYSLPRRQLFSSQACLYEGFLLYSSVIEYQGDQPKRTTGRRSGVKCEQNTCKSLGESQQKLEGLFTPTVLHLILRNQIWRWSGRHSVCALYMKHDVELQPEGLSSRKSSCSYSRISVNKYKCLCFT